MKNLFLVAISAVALTMSAGAASAQNNDFDQASDTTGWTVDRYAPTTFQSGVSGGGRTGVLEIGTNDGAGSNDRGPSYSSSFYNTQGMQFTLSGDYNQASIELYVPVDSTWSTATDDRFAGFWGLTDSGAYPIIELARVGGVDQFRAWDSGGVGSWLALSTPVTYGSWATLQFTLDTAADKIVYSVNGGPGLSVNAYGSTSIEKVFTQVHNTDPNGLNRTAFMDNMKTAAVPEPGTWALMILGFGGAGAVLRNKRRTQLATA